MNVWMGMINFECCTLDYSFCFRSNIFWITRTSCSRHWRNKRGMGVDLYRARVKDERNFQTGLSVWYYQADVERSTDQKNWYADRGDRTNARKRTRSLEILKIFLRPRVFTAHKCFCKNPYTFCIFAFDQKFNRKTFLCILCIFVLLMKSFSLKVPQLLNIDT